MNLKGMSLYEYDFPNSEPPGRDLDIKQGPKSVPSFGAEAPGPPPCRIERNQLF